MGPNLCCVIQTVVLCHPLLCFIVVFTLPAMHAAPPVSIMQSVAAISGCNDGVGFDTGLYTLTGVPYRYTGNLLRLQAATPSLCLAHAAELSRVSSPLLPRLSVWCTGLDDHPDREFARYVVEGLRVGFRIGFDYATPLRPAKRNMPSAAEHPEVIDQYVEGERAGDRILGPFVRGAIVGMQANRLGVVPKGHTPGKCSSLLTSPSRKGPASTTASTVDCARSSTRPSRMWPGLPRRWAGVPSWPNLT